MNLYPWSRPRAHLHGSMKEKLWKQMVLNSLNREMVSYQQGLLSAVSMYHTFSVVPSQFQMCWSLHNIVPYFHHQFNFTCNTPCFVLFCFPVQCSRWCLWANMDEGDKKKKDCFSVGVGWREGDSSFNFSIMLTHLFHFVVVVVVLSVCVCEPVLLPITRHGNRNSLWCEYSQ